MKATVTYIQPTNQFDERVYAQPDHYELSLEFRETGVGADHHDELIGFIEYLKGIADGRKTSVLAGLEPVSVRVAITGLICEARRAKGEF